MKKNITIVALSTPATVSVATLDLLRSASSLWLQTEHTPCVQPVLQSGAAYRTMDDLYETTEDFDALNLQIAQRLVDDPVDCVYAVPGRGPFHAQLAAIEAAAKQAGQTLTVLSGVGYSQAALSYLPSDDMLSFASDTFLLCQAHDMPEQIHPYLPLFVEELDTALCAGEVKLALGEFYPDEWMVYYCCMDALGAYQCSRIPLYQLDQQSQYHATSVLLVPPATFDDLERYGYDGLEQIVERLRAPGGCPWDREQTHVSLKSALLEECYEALDAIDSQNDDALCEELGDVLLQCAMHACIASEQARFTGRDITTGIVKKLIYRHPHVFANTTVKNADEVLVKWEELKKVEKQFQSQTDMMQAVPHNLPALVRSAKVQKKAAQVGFDWNSPKDALYKVLEEVEELRQAMTSGTGIDEELGDLLFSVVNVARLLKAQPELLLTDATNKFIDRFAIMEKIATENGQQFKELSLDAQNALWEQAKAKKQEN